MKDTYTLTINRFGGNRTTDRLNNLTFEEAKEEWEVSLELYQSINAGWIRDMSMRCKGKIVFAHTFRVKEEPARFKA